MIMARRSAFFKEGHVWAQKGASALPRTKSKSFDIDGDKVIS